MPKAERIETLPALTAIRGVAAILVVVVHYMITFVPSVAWQFGRYRPYLLLDMFFSMSGFVIAHVYGRSLAQDPRQSAAGFLRSRFARMYPLHIVTLMAVVLIVAVVPRPDADISFSIPNLLLQATLLGGPSSQLSWNFPSWSVSDEMIAYVLFIVAARPVMTGRHGWLIAAACVAALASAAASNHGVLLSAGLPGLTRAVAGFMLGALTYRAWRADRPALRRAFAWLVLPALVLGAVLRFETLIVLDLLMAMVLAMELKGAAGTALNRGPLQWIGDWSYSVYLWHVPLMFVAIGWCRAHAIDPATIQVGDAVAIILVLITTTLVVAASSYRWIEQPARRLLNGRRPRVQGVLRRPAIATAGRGP